MGAKGLLCFSTILLILTVNFAYGGKGEDDRSNEDKNDRRSNDRNREGGMDGYLNDNKNVIGRNGIDPRADGIDVGDFGPVYGKGGRPMYSSMNIWISSAEDWGQRGSGKYGGKGSKYGKNKKYNRKNDNNDYKNDGYKNDDYKNDDYKKDDYKNDDYKNDDYKKDDYKNDDYKKDDYKNDDYKNDDYKKDDYKKDDYKNDDYKGDNYKNNDYGGQRSKRSYKKINFPIKQVKNYRKFPFSLFPPLISIAPWLPIFYDKLTYQTFIFSLQGGLIIIPPLINFYGQRFAVAQLIKWGYASLVSSGAPPPPAVNVAPLIQPGAPAVAPAVAPGGAAVPAGPAKNPAPTYDSKTNKFNGGVKTDYPAFRPRPNYLQNEYNNQPAPNSPKYSN